MIARLLKRTSECAWLPLCCRLMRRNDSNGMWSARPWAFLVDVRRVGGFRPPATVYCSAVAVGEVAVVAVVSVWVWVVCGVTK